MHVRRDPVLLRCLLPVRMDYEEMKTLKICPNPKCLHPDPIPIDLSQAAKDAGYTGLWHCPACWNYFAEKTTAEVSKDFKVEVTLAKPDGEKPMSIGGIDHWIKL